MIHVDDPCLSHTDIHKSSSSTDSPITCPSRMDVSKETPSCNGITHLPLKNRPFQSDYLLKAESPIFYPCLKKWNDPKIYEPPF